MKRSILAILLLAPALASAQAQKRTCKDGTWQALGFPSQGACQNLVRSGTVLAWNAREDFALSPNEENPNPDRNGFLNVWHFLSSTGPAHDPATYGLLPQYEVRGHGREAWTTPAPGGTFPAPLVGVVNQFAELHPGNAGELAILGWRSPVSGTVNVVGEFFDGDPNGGDGVAWSVDHRTASQSVTLMSGTVDSAQPGLFPAGNGFRISVVVSEGDFLDFVVDARGNFTFDATVLNLVIVGPVE
ncbi:MAG: hypothetical protein ABL971_06830 [Vicinamibacterales bacterium]